MPVALIDGVLVKGAPAKCHNFSTFLSPVLSLAKCCTSSLSSEYSRHAESNAIIDLLSTNMQLPARMVRHVNAVCVCVQYFIPFVAGAGGGAGEEVEDLG